MNPEAKVLAEKQAELCRVFGNASRILIVWGLSGREMPVGEIADEVGTSLQNISQHLAVLKEHGLVVARREGQTIYYRIAEVEWTRDCPVLATAARQITTDP
jgi:ArsR family transcriptional regulator